MSLKYSVNFYDTRSLAFHNTLIGWCTGSAITHVGLQVDDGVRSVEYTCVDKTGIRVLNPRVYAKLACPPVDTVKLGIVDSSLPEILQPYHIKARSLIYYHFIGRYIGSAMPNGCSAFISNVLVTIGILSKPIFYPEQLYKELKKCR